MPTATTTLRASLEKHNTTFETLLNLIPARYYLVHDESEAQAASRYQKHSKKQKLPKHAAQEAHKQAKRDKLDPANQKSITELQAAAHAARAGKRKTHAPLTPTSNPPSSEDEDDPTSLDADTPILDDDGDDALLPDASAEPVPMPAAGGIQVLRDKLHARMASLRRGGPHGGAGAGEAGSRDELLEERRAQRAAMRERRRRETREKIRRQDEARAKPKASAPKDAGATRKGAAVKNQLLVDVRPRPGFTNVAFSAIADPSSSSPSKNAHKKIKTSSNPTQALAQLAAKKDRLAAMPDDKRRAVEERERWEKAEARMEGVKVRDDEGRLKKAAKRLEKGKEKSNKAWGERKEQLGASMAAKQKKRADNIAMRSDQRKQKAKGGGKKGGAGKPKGKARPGFEGKSFGGGKGTKKPMKGRA